jgi:uncharacterized membrane protein/YHS domain-containing protein
MFLVRLCAAAAVVLPVPNPAQGGPRASPGPPINTKCPVMTEEDVDPEITVEYMGRTIGFCCDRCVKKFQADPQRYLAALPADVRPGPAPAQSAAPSGAVPGVAAPVPGEKPVPLLGRLHPAIVHLPIAGLPLALLSLLVWKATAREDFARADVVPLAAAALGALAAVYSGNTAEEFMRFGAEQHELVERHERFGQIVLYVTLALCALRAWRWRRLSGPLAGVYIVGLLAATGLVLLTGYLGGSVVFGPEHFAW